MSIRDLEQSRADLTAIPPLEPNRLVGFINHFAINLLQQLNNLNTVADAKLHHIHSRVKIVKTNLFILERKLASVNGLAEESKPVAATTQLDDSKSDASLNHEPEPETRQITADDEEETVSQNESQSDASEGQAAPSQSANPEVERFVKMLRVGVPLPAVRMKMISEGVDPDLLKG